MKVEHAGKLYRAELSFIKFMDLHWKWKK